MIPKFKPEPKYSRDAYFMQIAFAVAQNSKCLRAHYGTIVVSADGRIISTGYNGKPRGSKNDAVCYRENLPPNSGEKPNCCIHSEANAIMFSDPVDRMAGTMYVSGIPCTDCALLIMQSGVSRVVYYNGPTASGHKGNLDAEFIEKYNSSLVEFVPFEFEQTNVTFTWSVG